MNKRELLSPADDTASHALVDVQTAITRVKTIISECVSKGVTDEELTRLLNNAISIECKKIKDGNFREQLRKSLVVSARKWHYELSQTYKILDRNLERQALKQPLNIDLSNLTRLTPYEKQIEFRKLLDDGANVGIPVIKDYQQSVRLAMKALSADPPKIVTTRNGKAYAMPARLRAELAVRYSAAVENLQRLINEGVNFCWISSHASCSPRCAPFQGKLYSLFEGKKEIDGKEYGVSGVIDGIPYRPINEALSGVKGDGNGCISGYNCRHRAIEYERGSKAPADYTEAEMKREYAIDKQQRSFENRIRQMKQEERQLRAIGMEKEASALRKKWRVLTKEYQIYSIEHDRAYYPYRYVIDRDEEIGVNVLTKQDKNDTINADEVSIEVDIATPCLIDKTTGAIVKTEMESITKKQVAAIDRGGEYGFCWGKVIRDNPSCAVAVLRVQGSNKVEGLVAYEKVESDNAYRIHNIEKSADNRGENGKYAGVAKHLFAYVSKIALDDGCDFLEFTAKSSLIEYYQETLGAHLAFGQRMFLTESQMRKLVDIYYPKGDENEKK